MVHRWVPNHPDSRQRSHVDRVIVLLQIEDKYVPMAESAVEMCEEVCGGVEASSNCESKVDSSQKSAADWQQQSNE